MLDKVVADQIVIISIPYSMIHSGHNHHVDRLSAFIKASASLKVVDGCTFLSMSPVISINRPFRFFASSLFVGILQVKKVFPVMLSV